MTDRLETRWHGTAVREIAQAVVEVRSWGEIDRNHEGVGHVVLSWRRGRLSLSSRVSGGGLGPMRALVLGTGSIGARHLGTLRLLEPGLSVTLVRRGARVDDLSRRVGAHCVATLGEGLRERPDFAVVATPSAVHAQAIVDLLAARVPIYVEKPVVTTRRGIDEVGAALASLSRPLTTMAGCNLRFLPSLQQVRELIRGGALGRIVRAQIQCGQWLPDWRSTDYRHTYSADASAGGGVVLDLIHELDAVRWILGECEVVGAALGRLSGLEITSEDTAVMVLRAQSGALVSVGLDYVARQRIRRYEFIGTKGTVVWDLGSQRLDVNGLEAPPLVSGAFDVAQTYVSAMTEFIACVASGEQTTQPLTDGLASVSLALSGKEIGSSWQ